MTVGPAATVTPEVPSDGLGLGLFIARQIIEMHGGPNAAELPPAGGSSLVVTLPPPPSPARPADT